MARYNNNGSEVQEHGSILDVIKEQTSNIEQFTNRRSFDLNLNDNLKIFAAKERIIRESTIAIRQVEGLNQESISKLIEENWVTPTNNKPPTYWKDKFNTYVQFSNREDKLKFIADTKAYTSYPSLTKLNGLISTENKFGNHFTRKEVKLEITNIHESIKVDKINKLLTDLKEKEGAMISIIKEGKLYGPIGRQHRSLMFKVDATGYDLIFNKLGGVIPYNSSTDDKCIKLWPRINTRPWSCRDCYYIGMDHKCEGKACAQCGANNHASKDCKQRTRFCTNCKKNGHRARDAHCPIYMREIIKELKRMDIPLEVLEDNAKRFDLVKTMIYK